MSVIGFHGDPCLYCLARRPGTIPRAAITHGCCAMCWLGASEPQRDSAILDELLTPPHAQQVARAKMDAERDAAFEAWGRL